MKTYNLYSTSACHLCEIAKGMILAHPGLGDGIEVQEIDISDSDELFERYGIRIPVLQHPNGSELGWPFDSAELDGFLTS